MRKSIVLVLAIPLLLAGCGHSQNQVKTSFAAASLEHPAPVVSIPNDSAVKGLTVRASGLPGAKHKTFANPDGKSTIERVLTWLKNAKEAGVEKQPPGKDGYPPGLMITTANGSTISVVPAVDWTVKKYSQSTVITGKSIVNYVAISASDHSQMVRMYSPELYRWIVNHEWE